MPSPRSQLGSQMELLAEQHLREQGLAPVERNFRDRHGEIDLIMRDGEQLVFVEVRYRRNRRFGGAAASVSAGKQQRLLAAAARYLQQQPGLRNCRCRFDVVAIEGERQINWIRNAFCG